MKGIFLRPCLLVFTLFISCSLKAQDGFRVYPYLQHPDSDAMSILWFSEVQLPGELIWWELGSGQSDSIESIPEAAEALSYPVWEDTLYFEGEAPSFPFRHRIRLEGLESGTTYEYLATQGSESFSGSFRTAPIGNGSIRFIVYADSETEPESTGNHTVWNDPVTGVLRSYLLDQTTGYGYNLDIIRSREPDFVLIAGDLTQHGGEQRDWDEFWLHNTNSENELSLAGNVPLMAAPGNHEYYEGTYMDQYNQPGSERAINRYLTYFEVPANEAPNPEQEGRYYSFTYGPATIIVLDLCNNNPNGSDDDTNFYLLGENDPGGGNAPDFVVGSQQYNWLETQLIEAQTNSLFTFVIFHHAPYSSGPHGFPAGIGEFFDNQSGVPTRALTPLFMQYGVDAVFSGHDEMWERSEVSGTERCDDENEVSHTIHFYDVGIGGDGLRGPALGSANPYQEFLVYDDVPEIWEEGVLVSGGVHYGHLEIDIKPVNDTSWQAVLKPVYVFPLYSEMDSAYSGYERRVYDDQVVLTRKVTDFTRSTGDRPTSDIYSRNYPNPFYNHTTIEYYLQNAGEITISITDALGRPVRILKDVFKSVGHYQTIWDGNSGSGNPAAPGIYYYVLENSLGKRLSGKMLKMNISSGSF